MTSLHLTPATRSVATIVLVVFFLRPSPSLSLSVFLVFLYTHSLRLSRSFSLSLALANDPCTSPDSLEPTIRRRVHRIRYPKRGPCPAETLTTAYDPSMKIFGLKSSELGTHSSPRPHKNKKKLCLFGGDGDGFRTSSCDNVIFQNRQHLTYFQPPPTESQKYKRYALNNRTGGEV